MNFAVAYEAKGSFPLPTDIGDVRTLRSYGGNVFVVAANALLIFDVHNPYDILKRITIPDQRLQDVSFSATEEGIHLLLTSNRGVYSQSLLDLDKPLQPVCGPLTSRSIYHAALLYGGDVYWLEYDEAAQSSELHSLKKGKATSYNGYVQPLIKLNDRQLLVISAEKLYLYDCEEGSVLSATLSHEERAEAVNMSCQPALDESAKAVYTVGEHHIWRITVVNNKLITLPLQLAPTGDERLTASEDHVFVARSNGFYILDTLGTIKWQADPLFIPEDISDGFAPQVDGKYCTFSGLKGTGSVIRIYNVKTPNIYTQGVPVDAGLNCAPLLSLGCLILAVGDRETGKQGLRIYQLKEAGT